MFYHHNVSSGKQFGSEGGILKLFIPTFKCIQHTNVQIYPLLSFYFVLNKFTKTISRAVVTN